MAQILASASCIRLYKRHRYGITGRSVCECHGEELIACFAFGIRRFAFLCGAVGGLRPRFCGSRFCGSQFCGSQTRVNLLQCQVPFLPSRGASQDPPVGHPGPPDPRAQETATPGICCESRRWFPLCCAGQWGAGGWALLLRHRGAGGCSSSGCSDVHLH